MPFMGKDFRGPGSEWIKANDGGWQKASDSRLELFESLHQEIMTREMKRSITTLPDENCGRRIVSESSAGESHWDETIHQPFFVVRRTRTRENLMTTNLSDLLLRLEFRVAIQDIRRFVYVSKFIELLIKCRFHLLGGRTQLHVVNLVEMICNRALETDCYVEVAQQLLDCFQAKLNDSRLDHVGSQQLWARHESALQRIQTQMSPPPATAPDTSVQPELRLANQPLGLAHLSATCLCRILGRLTQPRDIEAATLAHPTLEACVHGRAFWHQLVSRRFTAAQLRCVLDRGPEPGALDDGNWARIYALLMRRFGGLLSTEYACRLHHCSRCCALFWPIYGHPCTVETTAAELDGEKSPQGQIDSQPLSPEEVLNLLAW